ncbi:hypothetical protein IGI04_038294 [Brassica rapa subsp. trilocularis]|uniref:NAC domain-containing protein n=1 Tax=Brassica rapa subsp. trilocularis TaxID=1813537 RepID=A0ABQ7LJS8_BRACM|nr:hypothetical protein IGI04_038294 [Brassica rapa subsp. trilocularis]
MSVTNPSLDRKVYVRKKEQVIGYEYDPRDEGMIVKGLKWKLEEIYFYNVKMAEYNGKLLLLYVQAYLCKKKIKGDNLVCNGRIG